VYDTFGTPELGDVKMFMQKVHENNLGTTYSRSSVNTYKTADGTVLQFTVDAKIVSINGVPPIRDRTNGDVINNDGQGMVTITNPGLPGQQLVLDATIPPDHPTISVPGPIHLPNTCLGTTSYATLNVCNVNSASDDLLIYNIAPNNAQIAVVEPTSGYPTAVSHDFCYPFQVQYTPTVWSSLTSNLAISNSDPNQEYLKVEIDGSAIPPRVSVSGAGNFGNICVDSKAQQTITVGNTGSCSLTVTSIKIVDASGGDCPDFTIRNNPFPNSLGPNASLPATIEFTPTSGGSKTCSLVVASNDPETPELRIPLTATTPGVRLDVAAVGNYPATVIQSVGDCSSSNPLPVSNSGLCPVTIKSVEIAGANGPNYELSGLPSLTTPLQPGHVLGEGNLNVTFSPTQVPLSRGVSDSVIVSYEDDPITHHLTSTTQPLCGEDVTRGMRVLVINGKTGVPLPSVDKIQISRIGGNRKGISVDSAVNVPLQPAVNQNPPCASFKYHREWGGASNPVQLTTGDYQITINAKNPSNGKKTSKTISLTLGTCSFNQNIVVPF